MNGGRWVHVLAGVAGCSAVALGAYGAHGLSHKDAYFQEVYRRANQYHIYHALLMAAAPLARKPGLVAGLAAAGTVLFSGSCYTLALTEDRSWAKFAPIGGFTLMAAWLALAL